MTTSTSAATAAGTAPEHAEPDTGAGTLLFPGDTGTFDRATRVALVKLLRGPYLDGSADPEAWAALRRADPEVRRWLAEVFLVLVVDDGEQIAFTQQAAEPSEPYPKLLRHMSLSLVDSALLLYLRQELANAASRGQRAVVGTDEITAQLLPYRNERTTDHSVHRKRIDAAVKRMKDNGILRSTPTEGRFEVSPVLTILFPPDRIEGLLAAYERLGGGAQNDDDPDGGADDESEDGADDD